MEPPQVLPLHRTSHFHSQFRNQAERGSAGKQTEKTWQLVHNIYRGQSDLFVRIASAEVNLNQFLTVEKNLQCLCQAFSFNLKISQRYDASDAVATPAEAIMSSLFLLDSLQYFVELLEAPYAKKGSVASLNLLTFCERFQSLSVGGWQDKWNLSNPAQCRASALR